MYSQNDILQVAVLISCFLGSVFADSRPPNIIIVLTDDLGWNDVSFHGSNQIQTPNIDALAYNGIILNSHYTPALCTPSRASLLTGKYPTSMGMQHLVILPSEPWGLPLEETLMPQHFKRHGYSTHAIGKWHLGFHEKEYTPIYRGFDSHFGYWNGYQDYYDHTAASEAWKGYDMRRGLEIDYSSVGSYSTDAFTDEAVAIIKNHNSTQGPLFLYFSHLAPHSGNPDNPLQAPEKEVAKHSHIDDPERRIYAAMVTKVDESLGRIMRALKDADMCDNSIVLFMTDNGAVTFGMHSNRGSNYPMRGLKESPWEGGVRGVAAIWSPLLKETKRVSNQLMHMSDWLPTLFTAAGLDKFELGNIDGMDMWNVLSYNRESPRTEVFHNYDEIENYSSLMVDSWKIIEGTAQAGDVDLWYGESGKDCRLEYDVEKVLGSETNQAILSSPSEWKQSINKSGVNRSDPITAETISNLRQSSMIVCNYPTFFPFLFSIDNSTKSTADEINESFKSKPREFDDVLKFFDFKKKIISELEKIYQEHHPTFVEEREKFVFTHEDEIRIGNLIESGELQNTFECDPLKRLCLFNLKVDPCERLNLADIFPNVVDALKIRLSQLKKSVVKPLNQGDDPFSNPEFYNGTWTNWCDVRQDKSSLLFRKLKEFAYSVSYFGYLSTLFFENVFFSSLIYRPLLIIHESSVYVVQLNKWLLWLLGTGTIMVFAVGLAKRTTFSFRYDVKKNLLNQLSH